ncbi:MAG: substrate-binding periplasmic protein [Desulfovibrio sp.]
MTKIILPIIIFCITISTAIAQPHSVVIGTDEWPPYEFVDKKQVKGLSTDILKAVLNEMQIRVDSLAIYPWVRLMSIIEDGTVDIAYSAAFNADRAKRLIYSSEPLIESSWVMIIRKEDQDRLKFNEWTDLYGYRLGTVRGYLYNEEFDSYYKKNIDYEAVSGDKVNLKKLLNNRIDYIICDYYNAQFLISTLNIKDEVHIFQNTPVSRTQYYALFSPKTLNRSFAKEFSKVLASFKKTPQYTDIINSYMHRSDNSTK